MRQVLDAVAYLHSNRIAHRDLKPENILSVERNGREVIKLADFVCTFMRTSLCNTWQGLARSFGDGNAMNTACGSPLYVAPEIIRGEKYGPEVDVWACGVIIFILLSGYACFIARPLAKCIYCSVSPFPNGPDTNVLFRAIHANEWTFGPEWVNISDDAKDLVRACMVRGGF